MNKSDVLFLMAVVNLAQVLTPDDALKVGVFALLLGFIFKMLGK